MAVTSELATLHRAVAELRVAVGSVQSTYGDTPAVRRLIGDVDRIDLDAADLDPLPAPVRPSVVAEPVLLIDDKPPDPSLWADADDEGLGGYHRGATR